MLVVKNHRSKTGGLFLTDRYSTVLGITSVTTGRRPVESLDLKHQQARQEPVRGPNTAIHELYNARRDLFSALGTVYGRLITRAASEHANDLLMRILEKTQESEQPRAVEALVNAGVTYNQLCRILDSGLVISPDALKILKAGIRKYSDKVICVGQEPPKYNGTSK